MRKSLFLLGAIGLAAITSANAQEETTGKDYNKWSIEVGGGFNKPLRGTSSQFYTSYVSPFSVNAGVRYMTNPYFGFKLTGNYHSIVNQKDAAYEMDTNIYSVTLEGVANLGRVMHFESWTRSIGLLGHAGLGASFMSTGLDTKVYTYAEPLDDHGTDKMLTLNAGLTAQVKLSKSIALTGDLTASANQFQDYTYGGTPNNLQYLQGVMLHGTVGLTFYLGKAEQHADWYIEADKVQEQIDGLNNRVAGVEDKLKDSDNDGVPDYLDAEPNTPAGAMVDAKGNNIDKDGNGVPDALENKLDSKYASKEAMNNSNLGVEELLNGGYINVYFDFNSSKVSKQSAGSVNFIATYMKQNPSANIELIGYADEIGNSEYNKTLSEKRAQSVKDVLVASGIGEGRISITGNGEDASVEKSNGNARQLVRRVTVKIQ